MSADPRSRPAEGHHRPRFQSRPMAIGARGAVSTPHTLASAAALDVLRAGGNAVDAAVVAAAVCTVVQPFSSSLGGVGWATVYNRATRTTDVLQFHGTVPAGIDPNAFDPDAAGLVDWRALEAGGRGLLGSLTPSVVPGWEELLVRHGRWSLGQALQPAVTLAANGFCVSELLHHMIAGAAARLRPWPAAGAIYLPGGRVPAVGEQLHQGDLAATLTRIARRGSAEMVDGPTATAMVDFYAEHGGCVTLADLRRSAPVWHPPLVTNYRGHTIRAAPAPFGDVSFLAALGVLGLFPSFLGPDDPDYVHTSVESAKLVAAERLLHLGEGAEPKTVSALLETSHLSQLALAIDWRAAAGVVAAKASEDTITLAVVDDDGNAVHLMQTVGSPFGTGAVAGDTGVLLNSSLYFVYVDGVGANRIVPGGRVEQNPCVAMAFDRADDLCLVIGSPGGKTRVETVRQMLCNVVDFGMNLQQAVDAPRFLSASDGATINFEARYGPVDAPLRAELQRRGHLVDTVDDTFGSGQAVGIDPATGARFAAADWRHESVAMAW